MYLQTDDPLLVVSGFCVYSVASALFMFPSLHNYFLKALEACDPNSCALTVAHLVNTMSTRYIALRMVTGWVELVIWCCKDFHGL